jgi:hypothetical protein
VLGHFFGEEVRDDRLKRKKEDRNKKIRSRGEKTPLDRHDPGRTQRRCATDPAPFGPTLEHIMIRFSAVIFAVVLSSGVAAQAQDAPAADHSVGVCQAGTDISTTLFNLEQLQALLAQADRAVGQAASSEAETK